MTDLAPYAPPTTATVEPVKFLDMTGVSEDVLWAIGRASRMGQLVRVEDHAERPDGTVRARIAYSGETPQMPATALALPGPARPAPLLDERERWEAWDYVTAGLIATVVAMAGAALWGLYLAVMALGAWVAAHSAQIVGTLAIIAVIMLLALLGGGKACPGLHCGGCRG